MGTRNRDKATMPDQPDNPPTIAHRGSRLQTLAVCVFLLLAVAAVFGQTLNYGFINLDDDACLTQNPYVMDGLSLKSVGWAFTNYRVGNWDPLTWISHIADWQVYGNRAWGHHLTNLLLHAATTILLFLLLRQMTGRFWPSALVAALFAIHPLRVESVAWVTERKDVLSGLFFVLTLAAYVSYVRHGQFSILRYLAVIVLFALGLLSKPMLVTLPCVLLLLDYWPLRRIDFRRSGRGLSQFSRQGELDVANSPDCRENGTVPLAPECIGAFSSKRFPCSHWRGLAAG